MKIYTRTGDQGQTSLVGGQRVSKTCARLESYGTIDELCSHIGLLITYCTDPHDQRFLTDIQRALFKVGGYLATDTSQREVRPTNIVTADMVKDGAVIIDVGTTRVPSTETKSGFRLKGDVDFENVAPKCSFITPVPGGVGPMTIVSLMKNTLLAARHDIYK